MSDINDPDDPAIVTIHLKAAASSVNAGRGAELVAMLSQLMGIYVKTLPERDRFAAVEWFRISYGPSDVPAPTVRAVTT